MKLTKVFLEEITGLIHSARTNVARVVDLMQVYTNSEICRRIVQQEQKGKGRSFQRNTSPPSTGPLSTGSPSTSPLSAGPQSTGSQSANGGALYQPGATPQERRDPRAQGLKARPKRQPARFDGSDLWPSNPIKPHP